MTTTLRVHYVTVSVALELAFRNGSSASRVKARQREGLVCDTPRGQAGSFSPLEASVVLRLLHFVEPRLGRSFTKSAWELSVDWNVTIPDE